MTPSAKREILAVLVQDHGLPVRRDGEAYEWLNHVPRRTRRPPSPASSRCSSSLATRLTDSTGEWEVVGRPYTPAGGKNAHVRLQRVGQSGSVEVRTWGANERVSVKRANDKEPTP